MCHNNQQPTTTINKIDRGCSNERENKARVLLWPGADQRAVRFYGFSHLSATNRSDVVVVRRFMRESEKLIYVGVIGMKSKEHVEFGQEDSTCCWWMLSLSILMVVKWELSNELRP